MGRGWSGANGACNVAQRGILRRVIALLIACTALFTLALATQTRLPVAHADPTRYGADLNAVQAAVNAAGWPQQDHIWCGLAAMDAVINFDGKAVSQHDLADFLSADAAKSAWGVPAPDPSIAWGPGFPSDISRDVGTDPRAIAYGQTVEGGHPYHTVIDRVSAQDATYHLVADLIRTHEPIHVIVFRGGHSVLVSGVYATGDPVKDPTSITALEVWDPGFGIYDGNIQQAQMTVVPLDEWYTNKYYWSSPYQQDFHGTIAQDPDPAVGPYAYDPASGATAHLWVNNYVYFRADDPNDPAYGISQDWSFNQDDNLIQGQHGEMPSGWTGGAVRMLSDTLVQQPASDKKQQSSTTHSGPGASPSRGFCASGWCAAITRQSWSVYAIVGGLLLVFGGLLVVAGVRSELQFRRARPPEAEEHQMRASSPIWADEDEPTARWPTASYRRRDDWE